MTTLSLLKNRSEFGSLKIRPLFDRKVNPNPHHEWVSQELIQWSKGFADQNQRFDEMSVLFASYMYSGCQQRDRMLAMCKFSSFTMYLDYAAESARRERSALLMVELIEKLLTTVLTGRTDNDFVLGRRLLDTMEAVDVFMTRDQMRQLRDNLNVWFESQREVHCDYWLQNRFIPYNQYYNIRSKESGWLLFRLLADICAEYTPPESVLRSPPMAAFRTSTTRLALAIDDYLIFMTKMAANDITSGVMSYASTEKCSLQTALDSQFQLIKDLEAECQSLSTTIATESGPEFQTPALMAYVNTLFDMSYGEYSGIEVIYAYEVRDGVIWCPKWDQLKRQLLDDNKDLSVNCFNI
ncbi:unnamed protein product [Medioppia subpectinata]|uniref:Terpene synthase n=1 Tax=Medioppia subpectinata TaxID=1979941 RepID=A0A7R9L643_9ACAR|nr:unnamed protein product [Medioppia subpectinata]CAG2116077.1 unnamed protein product [Medioppia subpectinata]